MPLLIHCLGYRSVPQNNINISFMSVSRVAKGTQAIMAIGVDEAPTPEVSCCVASLALNAG